MRAAGMADIILLAPRSSGTCVRTEYVPLADAEDLRMAKAWDHACARRGGNVPKSRDGFRIASEELLKPLSQSSAPCAAVDMRRPMFCVSRAEHRIRLSGDASSGDS